MAFKSLLSPPASIGAAIGTGGLVFAIYAITVPNIATIHATDAHDTNVEAARKKAAISAALAALAVTVLSKDLNPWIVGGGAIILSDLYVRHANVSAPDGSGMVSNEDYGRIVGKWGSEYTQ